MKPEDRIGVSTEESRLRTKITQLEFENKDLKVKVSQLERAIHECEMKLK